MLEQKGWAGFVAQVRDRYFDGELLMSEFEHDLGVAILLDEGMLPRVEEIPSYLRDRLGLPLVFEQDALFR